MNKNHKLELLEQYMFEINVPIVGVVKPFHDEELVSTLKEHHRNNQYIFFGETTIEQRQNVEAVFPVCKEIIVIGIPYNTDEKLQLDGQEALDGFISNMAWAYDYHQVVKEKLSLLETYIQNIDPEVVSLKQVDTGPLIDRHIAHRAGIGAYGKNQCLMNAYYGTEFYIGYLMLDREIIGVETTVVSNNTLRALRCETCYACVRNCPANALTDAFEFMGQRCISYLTQKKEHLTWEERELIGMSVYGCDHCQLICPANRTKQEIPEVYKRKSLNRIDLMEFLSTSNKQLMRRYRETGFAWRGAKILKRNAIIALGNKKDKKSVLFLMDLLKNDNDYHTPYILWALYHCRSEKIAIICREILENTMDETIKRECESILHIVK